jgi:hypothetical protein
LQVSSVQTLPSLQLSGGPPTHEPPEHVSFIVQALPSLHGLALLTYMQPDAGLHDSSVHTFPSLQSSGAPPTHVPPEHVSFVLQALPPLHGALLLTYTQPEEGLHESLVQTLPSSQFSGGPPTHVPPEHASFVVQAFPSSHGSELLTYTHPDAGLQESSVQMFPSSQVSGGPPTHTPPKQVSPVVQALPSLHALVLLTYTHPEAGLQESSVQALPSSQVSGGPPTHAPPEHVSPVVQALPSLHGSVLLT